MGFSVSVVFLRSFFCTAFKPRNQVTVAADVFFYIFWSACKSVYPSAPLTLTFKLYVRNTVHILRMYASVGTHYQEESKITDLVTLTF